MKNLNVLISGASLAGPTLAFWLKRHGFNPTIVERAPAHREGGYKIDLRGAAVTVAERMGILDDIRARTTDMQKASFVDRRGRQVATMDGDVFGGRTETDAEILRGDLSSLIYQATRDDVEYLFDDSIASLLDGPDGVQVEFRSGLTRTFDLVIGADGVHSHTRRLVWGEESQFVKSLGHYISVFSVPNHLGLDRQEVTFVAPGRTALMYSTAGDSQAKAMFLFRAEQLRHDPQDPAQQRKLLAEAYADQGWEVPTLLEAMRETPDFYFDELCQVHMDSWSSGRVALLGDAAYCASPASGQGSSLALVGAYVLAGELARAAGDHTSGFANYETAMRDFVAQNQQLGPDNLTSMVIDSATKIWFQLRMLKLMPHMPGGDKIVKAIADKLATVSNAITLRDYR